MSKNQLVVTGKKSFTSVTDIIKNPSSASRLKAFIDEAVTAKIKILDQNLAFKSIRDAAVDDLGIQPKLFNSLVAVMFNNNFEEKLEEISELETALDCLMQTSPNRNTLPAND